LLNFLKTPLNRRKMDAWRARVDRIVGRPPGSDDGFSAEDISRSTTADFSKLSTWEIVCEEVLDTTHPCIYYERAQDELRRRGISAEDHKEMRRFAWLTAGWLNFEKMLWEWCKLGDRDILFAIDWQFRDGWISQRERDRLRRFAILHTSATTESPSPALASDVDSFEVPPPTR
jgi:hypothetical protein